MWMKDNQWTADYVLFMDSDIAVINPRHRIEEFIDDRFDLTFYDRFFNREIMAGSFLARQCLCIKKSQV
jgi:hypothetical protein